MQLTFECLNKLKYPGDLEDEITEHSRFNSELNAIGEYYDEASEIGLKDDKKSKVIDLFWIYKPRVKPFNNVKEPICSNIVDAANKHLMERLQLNHDYHWKPIINDATKYINELIESSDSRSNLRQKLQISFVPSGETYSFDKHYEMSWAHRFADKLLSLFEAPRNPLLDRNSEGWINCHLLAPLIDDCFLPCEEMSLVSFARKNISREESEKKQPEHKIDIIFRIDDMEYFCAKTFTDEDPIIRSQFLYKYKLFREMKDQLDRLLKKLKFTKETIKMNDIIGVLEVVDKIKKIALRTNSKKLFTIEDLPETTPTPKKDSERVV
ncbi:hypothetical protein C1646_752321 [Rhizophagus diaphanus]|nr:hypothetical protein C1646_752321 [Rhizophagus diaphanus] [Rhizophagus sp. MUCL 43196]